MENKPIRVMLIAHGDSYRVATTLDRAVPGLVAFTFLCEVELVSMRWSFSVTRTKRRTASFSWAELRLIENRLLVKASLSWNISASAPPSFTDRISLIFTNCLTRSSHSSLSAHNDREA